MDTPTPLTARHAARERVGVFIDYENTHRNGHQQFTDHGTNLYETVPNPVLLAKRIVAKRSRPSELAQVHVYRGRPNPQYQPLPAGAFDFQTGIWKEDPLCTVHSRPLQYTFPNRRLDESYFIAKEKGVDVQLAVDVVASAVGSVYDAVIVVSNDTDLLPAVEFVLGDTPTHIEIAQWVGVNPLWLREPRKNGQKIPYCHFLKAEEFSSVRCDSVRTFKPSDHVAN